MKCPYCQRTFPRKEQIINEIRESCGIDEDVRLHGLSLDNLIRIRDKLLK